MDFEKYFVKFDALSAHEGAEHHKQKAEITHGLLFWRNSPDSTEIFRLQKKIIRIMIGCRGRDSCRKLFFNLEILPLPSEYILSLLLFMIRNKNQFPVNSEIYHIDTRQHANFHEPSVNVTKYQKGVYYIGVKVFNMLSSYIKTEFDNPKKFKVVLQNFFYMKIPFIPWMNILNFKKVKYLHMNWIDIWKFWHACFFSLFINLYHISVRIYNQMKVQIIICNTVNYLLFSKLL
jgi:hypothetical protein